jgi:hypothetical protein
VKDLVAAERLEEVRIRGLHAPVTVYRMTVRTARADGSQVAGEA